jgi:hypothetical protein
MIPTFKVMKSKLTLVVLATTLVILTGCDPALDDPIIYTTSTAAPTTGTDAGACGSAGDTVKSHIGRPEVAAVTLIGQCGTVVIETTLADDNRDFALQICDAAAEVAYTGNVKSVRVLAKSGKQLSNGATGQQCQAA